MKKTIHISDDLKKVWEEYRILKSRSDHFGYKSLVLNGYPKLTDEEQEKKNVYHKKHVQFFMEAGQSLLLTPEFRDACWQEDGSCVLKKWNSVTILRWLIIAADERPR